MSLYAGNLLSASIGAIGELTSDIARERANKPPQGKHDMKQNYEFDPLSSCIGSLSSQVLRQSPEFTRAVSEQDPS